MFKSGLIAAAALAVALAFTGAADAACYKKGAKATAASEKSAKWYVLETIVQQVDWGAWPAFVANGSTPGYKIKDELYKCSKSGGSVTCIGQATLCETGK
jgi:hypothetical protein